MIDRKLNPVDQALDIDSRLVDVAWEQVAKMPRVGPPHSSGAVAGFPHEHRLPPNSFTGYRILREIHRGGQGVVYEAMQESTDRTVAIKVLKQGPFADDAELARFEREVHVLGRLKHPNIVTIHDRGSSAGHAFLVMDYVAGRSLDEFMAETDRSSATVLQLFVKICDAVHAAHLRGIIHRDLKPGNIRIDEGGEPHVLDFGLAKLAGSDGDDSSAQSLTITGQFVGSMPWTSPEQAMGAAHDIDLRSDVYSLGVILFQMLTGTFPYTVTGPTRQVQDNILHATPVRPSTVAPSIDGDVDTIVLKCLAKQPERRYQSAGELARDVRHYLSGEPIEARRDSFVYVLRKQLRKHRGATAAAAAFVILLVVGLTYCVEQWRRADREATRARMAERETKARADELEKVAKFQEAQLSGIDARTMGVRLRADLLEKVRATAEGLKMSPEETAARASELEKLIAGSDFTGLAMDALDKNFFKPTLAAIHEQFAGQPLIRARLLQTLASTLQQLGLVAMSAEPQDEALAIRRRELGDEHPDTLVSIRTMGNLLHAQGKLKEAEPYFREALEKRRRILGEEHPDTLTSINDLGLLLKVQGKLAEAEKYHKEALEKRRRILGEEHPDVLISIGHMGTMLQEQGRLQEAERYCREAVEKYRRILGEDHHDTIAAINNMGGVLLLQNKLEEAEQFYREAFEKARRVLGDEHPDTLATMINLANQLSAQGKLADAEGYYREILKKSRRILGDEHQYTLAAIGNLAYALQDEKRLEEAEPYFREALEKQRRLLGNEHPDTLLTIANIGALLHAQDKLVDAEPYYQEALEARRRVLGIEHPKTLSVTVRMGRLLQAQGKLADAERFYRDALEKSRRALGEEHVMTLTAKVLGGSLFQAQGRNEDAIALLVPVEPAARKAFIGQNALNLIRFLTTLGRARAAAGKFTEAETNLNEAFAIFKEAKGTTDRDRAEVLQGLVELYDAWHAAQPDGGYDQKAAEWRAKLQEFQTSTQPSATPAK